MLIYNFWAPWELSVRSGKRGKILHQSLTNLLFPSLHLGGSYMGVDISPYIFILCIQPSSVRMPSVRSTLKSGQKRRPAQTLEVGLRTLGRDLGG